MNILVPDPEPTVEVTFETKTAPCPGCKFYQAADEKKASLCTVEGRGLSSAVIKDCERFGWRQDL